MSTLSEWVAWATLLIVLAVVAVLVVVAVVVKKLLTNPATAIPTMAGLISPGSLKPKPHEMTAAGLDLSNFTAKD